MQWTTLFKTQTISNISLFVKKQKANIVFLQETHSQISDMNLWELESGQNILFNHSATQGAGTAIMCSSELRNSIDHTILVQGRVQAIAFTKNDLKFVLLNIYAPNKEKDRKEFFESLHEKIRTSLDYDYLILGGDLNTFQSPIDRLGSAPQSQIGTNSLKNLKDILQLIDIWRTKNPNKKDYTCRTKNAKMKSRLDYFLISKSSEQKFLKINTNGS